MIFLESQRFAGPRTQLQRFVLGLDCLTREDDGHVGGMDEVMGKAVRCNTGVTMGNGETCCQFWVAAGRVAWRGAALLCSPTFCAYLPCHVDPNSSN